MRLIPFSPTLARMLLMTAIGLCSFGCSRQQNSADTQVIPESGRITFIQWSDPHLFDAGAPREREGVEEERLDNWSALHWAVLQTNRFIVEDRREIDFIVLTGDLGLYNVKIDLPDLQDAKGQVRHDQNCARDPREGPGPAIPLDEAARQMARELLALRVKKVFLVPGNNDLCDEDPRNLYRYATFVASLQQAIQKQEDERRADLKSVAESLLKEQQARGITNPTSGLPVEPPAPPRVVDLTFTLSRLFEANPNDARVPALTAQMDDGKQALAPITKPSDAESCGTGIPALTYVKGFCLLGLDTSYFKAHADSSGKANAIQPIANTQIAGAIDRLNTQIKAGSGNLYLLFTHIPDIEDPSPGRKADPGSS
jgi:hypothetical protein